MGNQQLEVGMKVLLEMYGALSDFGKVSRVTNKRAFVGSLKFERTLDGKYLQPIPRGDRSIKTYFIPDEDDLKEMRRQELRRFVCGFNYSQLSVEKMAEISDIIKRK